MADLNLMWRLPLTTEFQKCQNGLCDLHLEKVKFRGHQMSDSIAEYRLAPPLLVGLTFETGSYHSSMVLTIHAEGA